MHAKTRLGVVTRRRLLALLAWLGTLPFVRPSRAEKPRSRKEFVLMLGIPAAGKTTIAQRRFPSHKMLDPDTERWTDAQTMKALKAALESDQDIVFSDTSEADDATLDSFIKLVHLYQHHDVRLVFVKTSVATALQRNAARARKVPEAKIRRAAASIDAVFRRLSRVADSVDEVAND
jgi:predicted kinase